MCNKITKFKKLHVVINRDIEERKNLSPAFDTIEDVCDYLDLPQQSKQHSKKCHGK